MKRVACRAWLLAFCFTAFSSTGRAQNSETILSGPISAVPVEQSAMVLPRNTPVYLTLNETLNSKSKRTKKGSTFTLSVARNVTLDRYIVIPRGSKAIGTVVMRTRKGGFGKSGKMEISLDYIELGDHRIAIQGGHREEGEGNSTATVATFVFLSILGSGLITGHSAEIPAKSEFTAWTKDDLPVQFPDSGLNQPAILADAIVARPLPTTNTALPLDADRPRFGNRRIKCTTCR